MCNFLKSRGCRNNNPFNIVKSRHNWIGKVKGDDPKFETFVHIGYGLRAGIKLLLTYIQRGYNTPRKIINRFAPPSENATNSYLDFITYNYRGERFISPDDVVVSLDDFAMLCSRIVKYENGLSYCALSAISADPDGIKKIIDKYNLKPILIY